MRMAASGVGREVALPALLRRYVERSLPTNGSVPRRVRITQEGEMRKTPRARPLRFTAIEELAVGKVEFAWRARFPLLPRVAMTVVDKYADGEGELVARLLGIPVMRQRGPETALGEALRYLAELPWVPQAIAANAQLEWRELEADTVEVATAVAGTRLAVRFHFDNAGDIVRASCDARPRPAGKTFVPTPWGGSFGDYKVLGQTRLPTSAEVSWELADGPFVYWRGTVKSLELVVREPSQATTRS